jgi:hypothetical protein
MNLYYVCGIQFDNNWNEYPFQSTPVKTERAAKSKLSKLKKDFRFADLVVKQIHVVI